MSHSPAASLQIIALATPVTDGVLTLETALLRRRSVREFSNEPLPAAAVGQLLWAAQGVSDAAGHRTTPSAGALYPLDVYLASAEGVFHYEPDRHALTHLVNRDTRKPLCDAALAQLPVVRAPVVIVITAVFARTEATYGSVRAARYVYLEAGHAAQNVLLQAVALGLAAVPIGAFDDTRVGTALELPSEQQPLYLIPVGYPLAQVGRAGHGTPGGR